MKKLITLGLTLGLLFCNILSVSAETVNVEYTDGVSDPTDISQTTNIGFVAEQGSTFIVCLPKEVALSNDGTDYSLKAGIYADLDSSKKLSIAPIDMIADTADVIDFNIENIAPEGFLAKPSVVATVIATKTEWNYDDTDFCADPVLVTDESVQVEVCTVAVDNVSSGEWSGKLAIRIALEDVE